MIVVLFLSLGLTVHAKLLPPGVPLCHKSDPNFNECLKTTMPAGLKKFASGYKPLGMNNLEPLFIETMDLGETRSGSLSLAQRYDNVKLYGLTESTILDIKANFSGDNCYWHVRALTPVMKLEAVYTLKGQLFVFSINGHGNSTTILRDMEATHDFKCERFWKKGKRYIRGTHLRMSVMPKKAEFNFERIVDGNERLNEQIIKTVNENSLTVFNDLKGAFERSFEYIYLELGNRVFTQVPEDEIFPD